MSGHRSNAGSPRFSAILGVDLDAGREVVAPETITISQSALAAWAADSAGLLGAIDGLAASDPRLAEIARRCLAAEADRLRRSMARAGYPCPGELTPGHHTLHDIRAAAGERGLR